MKPIWFCAVSLVWMQMSYRNKKSQSIVNGNNDREQLSFRKAKAKVKVKVKVKAEAKAKVKAKMKVGNDYAE